MMRLPCHPSDRTRVWWTAACVALQVIAVCLFADGFLNITDALAIRSVIAHPRTSVHYSTGTPEHASSQLPSADRPDATGTNYDRKGTAPPFDRLILVVIDALRSDFVFGSEGWMPHIQSRLVNGTALGFESVAVTPTVTLPRLKALVGGLAPSFVDALLNFNSPEFHGDNLVDAILSTGKKAVFYGDDTWLRLFPGRFVRHEGTSSFFVGDYTSVDDNVTRNVWPELERGDWGLAILHYLGLDHIGHGHGASRVLIEEKLREMDSIVERIVATVSEGDARTVVVVCGDHGMTTGGGHGGSSRDETHTAFVALSNRFSPSDAHRPDSLDILPHSSEPLLHESLDRASTPQPIAQPVKCRQTQIAATLSVLTGVGIPSQSHEFPVIDLLRQSVSLVELCDVVARRATELADRHGMLRSPYGALGDNAALPRTGADQQKSLDILFDDAQRFRSLLVHAVGDGGDAALAHAAYESHIRLADAVTARLDRVSESRGNNTEAGRMLAGLMASAIAAVGSIALLLHTHGCISRESNARASVVSTVVHPTGSIAKESNKSDIHAPFDCSSVGSPHTVDSGASDRFTCDAPSFGVACVSVVVVHAASIAASSFVEEEHNVWYFAASSLAFYRLILDVAAICASSRRRAINACTSGVDLSPVALVHRFTRISISLVSLVALRVLRAYSRNGVKWLTVPALADYLSAADSSEGLVFTVVSSLIICFFGIAASYRHATSSLLLQGSTFVRPSSSLTAKAWSFLSANVLAACFLAVFVIRTLDAVCESSVKLTYGDTLSPSWTLIAPVCADHVSVRQLALPMVQAIVFAVSLVSVLLSGRVAAESSFCTLALCVALITALVQPAHKLPFFAIIYTLSVALCAVARSPRVRFNTHSHRQCIPFASHTNTGDAHSLGDAPIGHVSLSWIFIVLVVGKCAHFAQGNSNTLSTLDVASAYIGASEYSQLRVGTLAFLCNFGNQLYWPLFALCVTASDGLAGIQNTASVFVASRSVSLLAVLGTVFSMRNHLFVWSVFAPRLLYECVETLSLLVVSVATIPVVAMHGVQ